MGLRVHRRQRDEAPTSYRACSLYSTTWIIEQTCQSRVARQERREKARKGFELLCSEEIKKSSRRESIERTFAGLWSEHSKSWQQWLACWRNSMVYISSGN